MEENTRYLNTLLDKVGRRIEETAGLIRENAERQRENAERQREKAERQWEKAERQWEKAEQEAERQREYAEQQRKEAERDREDQKERQRELDRRFKETDRQLGRLGNRFGELAEHLVAPNIKEKFNALGYRFDYNYANAEVRAEGRVVAEVDILLENSEYALAVEVKSKPVVKDVLDHVRRMEMLRRYPHRFKDGRVKLLGAIAGAVLTDTVRDYITKHGFFVIEQSGDTVKINVPEGFKPREW
jgi:hypothetical protein